MSLLGQYEYIIDKSHPRAYDDGQVYVHILAAEQKMGRPLLPNEVVHHKDFNKQNNDPDNLMVFASSSDHCAFHSNNCDESMLSLNEDGAYVCSRRQYKCIDCGKEITKWAKRCPECHDLHMINSRKVERPTADELYILLVKSGGNFTKIAKMFNVSDNGIRKWCKFYGLPYHSSDYRNCTDMG